MHLTVLLKRLLNFSDVTCRPRVWKWHIGCCCGFRFEGGIRGISLSSVQSANWTYTARTEPKFQFMMTWKIRTFRVCSLTILQAAMVYFECGKHEPHTSAANIAVSIERLQLGSPCVRDLKLHSLNCCRRNETAIPTCFGVIAWAEPHTKFGTDLHFVCSNIVGDCLV